MIPGEFILVLKMYCVVDASLDNRRNNMRIMVSALAVRDLRLAPSISYLDTNDRERARGFVPKESILDTDKNLVLLKSAKIRFLGTNRVLFPFSG